MPFKSQRSVARSRSSSLEARSRIRHSWNGIASVKKAWFIAHFTAARDGSMTTVPWGQLEGLVSAEREGCPMNAIQRRVIAAAT